MVRRTVAKIMQYNNKMTAHRLPLLASSADLESPIAWRHHQPIHRALFLHHVVVIARQLPTTRFIVNLCEDRYRFMAAFAAVGVNGQTNLLPSSRAPLHLQRLLEDYPDSTLITDCDVESWLASATTEDAADCIPQLPADQVMAVAFTSGSTGRAKPHLKRWGELVSGARQAQQRFGFSSTTVIVATVPPQHMYGLETSIMAPWFSGASVYDGRPFFPDDVRAALTEVPTPRVLVTTPIHLQACVRAGLRWPEVRFLISATAPLDATLAAQAEQLFHAPVLEIYGCTEAGSIASRRTVHGELWRLYEGFRLNHGELSGVHLPEPVPLNDQVEVHDETRFRLLGRHEDMINIAGKRMSLAYLNQQLREITGVVDGIFALPSEGEIEARRLMAAVVAPDLSERQILAALADRLDPVFLPRPLLKVDALPRNATGKISREALLNLITTTHRSYDR